MTPVNPHLEEFEGDRCYPDVRSIPGGADGVVIITRPEVTERIVCMRWLLKLTGGLPK